MHRRRVVRSLGSPVVARLFQCRAFHDTREYKEDKRWPGWQVVIGIETHAQIKSRLKLFSRPPSSPLSACAADNRDRRRPMQGLMTRRIHTLCRSTLPFPGRCP